MLSHPDFFDAVPQIRLYDPLAEFLGAAEQGMLEYSYFDAVRLAGHSCPTVAAAYWSTCRALAYLYPEKLAERGNIRVEFSQASNNGVTGVIANVVSMLTGAMADSGFKGIGGRFDRRALLHFAVEMSADMRFTRLDTNQAVLVTVRLQQLPSSHHLSRLMAACLSNAASAAEVVEFRKLWQDRVRSILLEHGNDPEIFVVTAD